MVGLVLLLVCGTKWLIVLITLESCHQEDNNGQQDLASIVSLIHFYGILYLSKITFFIKQVIVHFNICYKNYLGY